MSNSDLTEILSERSAPGGLHPTEQLHTEVMLHDRTLVILRPIHANDVALERRFLEALSPSARHYRFLETLNTPSEALLKMMTQINPTTDVAYVAVLGTGDAEVEIGVGRCRPALLQ